MTISDRNKVFRAGIIFSAAALLAGIAASPVLLPVYAYMETYTVPRPGGFFQTVVAGRLTANFTAAHFAVLAMALYSLLAMALIAFFFEKTQSPEIIFVAFFVVSLSAEVFRLAVPMGRIYGIPSLYMLMASRIILFGRYFGIFSLFAASVHAAGYQSQQQRNAIIVIVATALFVSLGIPVDTQTPDTSLMPTGGYAALFTLIETGIFVITAASFFIAAVPRGSREFVFIGTGSVLMLAGRNILLHADTWAALPTGFVLLAAGTWLVCTRLHRIYLWL